MNNDANLLNKSACGSREDLNRADTCHKFLEPAFFREKKAPAAAWKTTTELIHVINSWNRHFSGKKKNACGSLEDLNKA